MSKIQIAIDIDGVLANSLALYKEIAKKEGVTKSFDQSYGGIYKVYTKDSEVFGKVLFTKYRQQLITDVKPIEGTQKAFQKFVNNKHIEVYIVTARYEDAKENTIKWLKDNGFTGYKELLFLKDKTKAPCSVLIDDSSKKVKSYWDKARMGILVNQPYNQNTMYGQRVDDLEEAYQYIMSYV